MQMPGLPPVQKFVSSTGIRIYRIPCQVFEALSARVYLLLGMSVGDVLLSADHILARTVSQQWPESIAAWTGLGHYLDSLDKVQRMPGFVLTLPAHEQAIHDVYRRIDTIRGALVRRLDRLLEMLRKIRRPLSVDEINEELYAEVSGFRAMLAITDVGSRVEYLHQRGQLIVANLDECRREENPVYRYAVAK
jgi:hypothetical protein